jgi:hypothetical protein
MGQGLTAATSNQSAAANRRPAGQSDGGWKFLTTHCNRRAFPVAVAELGVVRRKIL